MALICISPALIEMRLFTPASPWRSLQRAAPPPSPPSLSPFAGPRRCGAIAGAAPGSGPCPRGEGCEGSPLPACAPLSAPGRGARRGGHAGTLGWAPTGLPPPEVISGRTAGHPAASFRPCKALARRPKKTPLEVLLRNVSLGISMRFIQLVPQY